MLSVRWLMANPVILGVIVRSPMMTFTAPSRSLEAVHLPLQYSLKASMTMLQIRSKMQVYLATMQTLRHSRAGETWLLLAFLL